MGYVSSNNRGGTKGWLLGGILVLSVCVQQANQTDVTFFLPRGKINFLSHEGICFLPRSTMSLIITIVLSNFKRALGRNSIMRRLNTPSFCFSSWDCFSFKTLVVGSLYSFPHLPEIPKPLLSVFVFLRQISTHYIGPGSL